MGKIIVFNNTLIKENKMNKNVIQEIRKKSNKIEDMPKRAKELLDGYDIQFSSEGYPITEILAKANIGAYQGTLSPRDLSAYIAVSPKYLEKFNCNKIACVNKEDSFGHKRFAFAHELAHYIFDFDEENQLEYYNTYYANEENNMKFEEQRANAFAANLLMPEEIFCNKYNEIMRMTNSKVDTITMLAKQFGVSATAIQKRLKELDIERE